MTQTHLGHGLVKGEHEGVPGTQTLLHPKVQRHCTQEVRLGGDAPRALSQTTRVHRATRSHGSTGPQGHRVHRATGPQGHRATGPQGHRQTHRP